MRTVKARMHDTGIRVHALRCSQTSLWLFWREITRDGLVDGAGHMLDIGGTYACHADAAVLEHVPTKV